MKNRGGLNLAPCYAGATVGVVNPTRRNARQGVAQRDRTTEQLGDVLDAHLAGYGFDVVAGR